MPPTTATPPVPPQSEEEEWAVEEDCSVPVEDFEEKIPDPAFKVGGGQNGEGGQGVPWEETVGKGRQLGGSGDLRNAGGGLGEDLWMIWGSWVGLKGRRDLWGCPWWVWGCGGGWGALGELLGFEGPL